MIRVFIVDDHELVREGLKKILSTEPDVEVTGEAQNGEEALKKIPDVECDVILLDITMPGRSGLDLVDEFKMLKPGIRILILSIHDEDRFALLALRAGASGYLSKDTALEELMKAIRKVYQGGKYLSPALERKLT